MTDLFYRVRGDTLNRFTIECRMSIGQSSVAGSTRTHYVLAPVRADGGFDPVGLIAYPVEGIGKPATWFTSAQSAKADAIKRVKATLDEIKEANRCLEKEYQDSINAIKSLEYEVVHD